MKQSIAILALALCSCDQLVGMSMQDINDKVAADAVAQYRIVETSGTKIDKCVQAGMVSAAYLQAQDNAQYSYWKSMENVACAHAGVPRP